MSNPIIASGKGWYERADGTFVVKVGRGGSKVVRGPRNKIGPAQTRGGLVRRSLGAIAALYRCARKARRGS